MPAANSNSVQMSPKSDGSGHIVLSEMAGVSIAGKSPGKRQRKSTTLPVEGSLQKANSGTGKGVKMRKRAKQQRSEPDATLATNSATYRTPKTPRRRLGQDLGIRTTMARLKTKSQVRSPLEAPKASERSLKLSRMRSSKLNQDNGRHPGVTITALKENGMNRGGSLSGGEVSASRMNPPRLASDRTLPENARDAEMDTGQRKRRQRRRKDAGAKVEEGAKVDEKMRIKRRVKNLVNRIRLEQNLLDAYANEGWKGNSREKIRPEKELQRAHMQILRCKLEIRDLIHELDTLGLDGSLEESAFDEEGRVFHEQIFCAKCKSKESSADNDIILCDGACDRGFHQKCIDPPLSTIDIPPGDEDWLCPVCASKLECLNYINGYLGTEFRLEDQWEMLFDVDAGVSRGLSNAMVEDWPSEDSEDQDYTPEGKAIQDGNDQEQGGGYNVLKGDSLSDSKSDPEASSEFYSSNGEDSQSSGVSGDELGYSDDRFQRGDRGDAIDLHGGNINKYPEIPAATAATEHEDVALVSGKRLRKPVDYRKLHNEMFGEEFVDDVHSEDEEWGPGRRGRPGKSEGSNRINKISCDGSVLGKEHHSVRPKSFVGHQSDGVSDHNLNQCKYYSGHQSNRGKARRLPDGAVEKLRKEFETGTHFPTRVYKEGLAQNLGISFQQVCSWFKNARRPNNPSQVQGKNEVSVSNGNLRNREGALDGMETTNCLLVEKLDELQLKLHYLKQTLETMVAKGNASSDCNLLEEPGDADIVMLRPMEKRIVYVPVAEVVEKVAKRAPKNGKLQHSVAFDQLKLNVRMKNEWS